MPALRGRQVALIPNHRACNPRISPGASLKGESQLRYGRLMAMTIVLAGAPFAPAALAQQNAKQPQKWEYKTFNSCSNADREIDIHQLGEEGWELVATEVAGENQCVTLYFKRPKGTDSKHVAKQAPQQSTAPKC